MRRACRSYHRFRPRDKDTDRTRAARHRPANSPSASAASASGARRVTAPDRAAAMPRTSAPPRRPLGRGEGLDPEHAADEEAEGAPVALQDEHVAGSARERLRREPHQRGEVHHRHHAAAEVHDASHRLRRPRNAREGRLRDHHLADGLEREREALARHPEDDVARPVGRRPRRLGTGHALARVRHGS